MAVCRVGVRRRPAGDGCNSVTRIITLPPGRVMERGCRPKRVFVESRGRGFRQGFPVALMRTSELGSDLVDGVFVTVMRCLGS